MDSSNASQPMLLLAVLQDQDVDRTLMGLEHIQISASTLPSIGGFLGRQRKTLLIGCTSDLKDQIVRVLRENCHERLEYMALPIDNTPMTIPLVTQMPISVGGATLFTFEVEHMEEF